MKEIKPKDNKAHLLLVCEAPKRKDCVYYREDEVGNCEHICGPYCISSIAMVDKCVLYLKEQGVLGLEEQEVQGKKGKKKMTKYEYDNQKNKFIENGHTMFEEDVLQRLRRLEYLEEKLKQDKKNKGCPNCGLEKSRTT